MTNNIFSYASIFAALIFVSNTTFSQVKSIGINVNKKGYIEYISVNEHKIEIDFILSGAIETQVLQATASSILKSEKGDPIKFENLKTGMQVLIDGEYFKTKDSTAITTLTVLPIDSKNKKIEKGRIDGMKDNFAFVDGSKVKLGNGVTIKGINGYKGKKFDSFNSLVLGDLMNLDCTFDNNGYYVVSKAEVEPDLQTNFDVLAAEDAIHDKMYPVWSNPKTKPSLLGETIPGIGRIANSLALQTYVEKIGMSLIPSHLREKNRIMFVVISGGPVNAYMKQSGFCVVYANLLAEVSNEAQLAAILGHEITHAYYEHIAKRIENQQNASEKKQKAEKITGVFNSIIDKVKPVVTVTNKNNKVIEQTKIDTGTTNALFKNLPAAIIDKQLSNYSVDNELQSDRVGLYLMANAGYDPREAPVFWKKQYNVDDSSDEKDGNRSSLLASSINNMKTSKNPNAFALGGSVVNQVFTKKLNNIKTSSKATHPDNLRRYETLNQLIYLNYSNSGDLESSVTNEKTWVEKFKSMRDELNLDTYYYLDGIATEAKDKIVVIDYGLSIGVKPIDVLYKRRGDCNVILDNFTEAIADYTKAIGLKPNNAELYYDRAIAKNESGKSLEALTDFNKAITLKKDVPQYYFERARCLLKMSKLKEALLSFDQAIQLNTTYASAYFYRGNTNYKLLNYQAAISDYKKVLEITPDETAAANNIEVCKSALQKKKTGPIIMVIQQDNDN